MSAETRQAIAAAVTGVEDLNCTPYFRQSIKAGDAMVRMDRMIRASNGVWFMTVWQVLVALPTSIADAEKYLEARITPLLEALDPVLVITGVQQKELVMEGGATVPVVVIEGNRASD